MTVKTLIELLQKCPQNNIVVFDYIGERIGIDDVYLESKTYRVFTYLSGAGSTGRIETRCKDCKHYDGRPCGLVNWYNTDDDYCSKYESKGVTV